MCSLALALTGITTGLSAYGQYQQGKAMSAAYEAQAEAAYQNAKILNKRSELMADQYAQKQRELDDRRRLVTGQQIAAAGASGISSNVGSPLDVYTSSMEGWQQDTVNLLTNQRNDQWSNYVNEVNYRNRGNTYSAYADAAKQAGTIGAIGTLLGGAASMYGMKGWGGSNASNTTKTWVGNVPRSVHEATGTGIGTYVTPRRVY